MRDLKEKTRAIKLRKQGKTYREIQKICNNIPKSTLNYWYKNIELTKKQKENIQNRIQNPMDLGRQKGGWTNHNKRLKRLAKIKQKAIEEWPILSKNPLFIAGLAFYLAEGSKTQEKFQFMNSDPKIIFFMLEWIIKILNINQEKIKFRLYIHHIYKHEEPEIFWKKLLNTKYLSITLKPTPHKIKKRPDYKGCLRIEVSGSELYLKIMTWRDKLLK